MDVLELLVDNSNEHIRKDEIGNHNEHDPKYIVDYSLWIKIVHKAGPRLTGTCSEQGCHRQVESTEICIRGDEAKFTWCYVTEKTHASYRKGKQNQ